jgi:hypothetical protein
VQFQAVSTTSLAPFTVNVFVYLIFGFANKYLYSFGDVVFFHDDDPLVLKESNHSWKTVDMKSIQGVRS